MGKNENIEITRILDIMKSKKLVILLILIIFTILGYLYSYHYVVPKYKATSTLLLIPNSTTQEKVIMTSDLTVNADLTVNSGLIETYRSIGENSKVIKQVIQNLGLPITEQELRKEMKISVIKDTYIIQVAVTNTDPQKAMQIAKEFDEVFLQEIKDIYHLNNIGIIDEAQLPEEPNNINHGKDMLLFFAIGMGVAIITLIIFYFFDNTIKTEEEIEKYVHLKSLGNIPISQDKTQEIVNRDNAKSYVTECINTIRTNILYMNATKNAKTILITSCTPREGKSWVSANIATAFAETNQKVLLIDADMRKGRAHKIFEVDHQEGLSNYLYAITGEKKKDIMLGKEYIKETKIPNLHILTNGTIPPNPSELLESEKMKKLLEQLKNMYDIIIIDAPPCKLVTDSIILSTIVDSTVLVANAENTKMNDFIEVKKSIQMVDGEIIGAILNKKKVAGKTYRKGYYYGQIETKELKQVRQKEIIAVEEVIKQSIAKLEEEEETIIIDEMLTKEVQEEKPIQVVEKDENTYRKIKKILKNQQKDSEEALEFLVNERITEMQKETQELLKQEITKIDVTDQILQINEILSNLKDSYVELTSKVNEKEREEEPIVIPEKGKNVIDFKAFMKKSKNKKVYSIEEDISYQDLEETAIYVVPLESKVEKYHHAM